MSGKCIKTGKSRKRNAVKYLPRLWYTLHKEVIGLSFYFLLSAPLLGEAFLYRFGGILGIAFICYIVYNTLALYP